MGAATSSPSPGEGGSPRSGGVGWRGRKFGCEWRISRLLRPTLSHISLRSMRADSPPLGEGWPLRPVRIEPLFKPLPAIGVVVLQRRGLGSVFGDALRVAGLEHEGHGAGQLDRLELGIAGMVERLAIGA